MSSDIKFSKFGATCLIFGGILSILGIALHPYSIPSSSQAHFQAIAHSLYWIPIHLIIILARILYLIGFVTFAEFFKDQQTKIISKIGLYFIILATAVSAVLVTIDGFVLKILADKWIVSSGLDQLIYFNILSAFQQVEIKLYNIFSLLYYGIAFLFFGQASKKAKEKDWLIPTFSGFIVIITTCYHLIHTFTLSTTIILTFFIFTQNIWMCYRGTKLLIGNK